MVGTQHRDHHQKRTESFLEYKACEASRIQTYFYGLVAVAIYAVFEVGTQRPNSQLLNGLLITVMILSCAGYYFWHITEIVIQKHLDCLSHIANLEDHLMDAQYQSDQNRKNLIQLNDQLQALYKVWKEGHLLSLGGAMGGTMALLAAVYCYAFNIVLDANYLKAMLPILFCTLIIMIGATHKSYLNAES